MADILAMRSARCEGTADEAKVGVASAAAPGIGSSIAIRNVVKAYGGYRAADDISLDINPGEFITLLGPSGSGKTTLLNLVAGFQKPNGGEILVDGRPIHNVAPHRRGFGMVFQSYALFPNMTVTQNVAFPLRMAGVDRETTERRVAETLEIMRLSEHARKLPSQMSGGQQQRVAIARAIVRRPKVVLMDEPLSALDRRLREQIQIEIRDLHQTLGSTILFVTHDQGEALTMSDRIAVLDAGKIVQVAAPVEIYRHPSTRFVAAFVGESNLIDVEILQKRGTTMTLRNQAGYVFDAETRSPVEVGRATVLVRPERIAISTAVTPNALPVTVRSAIFLGEILRIEADTDQGERLLVRCTDSAERPLPSPGDRLYATWRAEDCWVLP
ncbi:putative spermidine/putrescine transport system ATP-binding protein [Pseudaminobacter salicylatoxidans]|uniref:Spermidine/putrescine import ATP-binding protein PotA n=1 Tax=Pseudaminobacter salicylatoxidans TaxID=93369 RepID=A0A316CAH0_PSESE|nr:ABC transporter ATP-binding protein [Pseudaminobacter salicylatoxidans]PWJ86173.1 putative spermidine/putrescine transport system ATP-binding protein [Pseudaminobacter salicylatoxidans]